MRHAKTEKAEPLQKDFDRALVKRGKEDLLHIVNYIKLNKIAAEYIVASPSKRTKQTTEIVAELLKIKVHKIDFEYIIYEASISDLISVVREIPEEINTALLIGHNPSITGLVGYLTNNFVEHIATSGIAILKFNVNNWKLISQNCANLVALKNPKDL